jgi:hypothetical protein
MNQRETRYWIVVMDKLHADAAVAGGYLEVSHGKSAPLERMSAGDGIACYSPRHDGPDGPPLQAFTALGRVDGAPITQSRDAHQPFRRGMAWTTVRCAPIRPLLADLGFIRNKSHWGAAFRFGYVRVPGEDFARIAAALQASGDHAAARGEPRALVAAGECR